MSRRRPSHKGHEVEVWQGHQIYVTDTGKFFVLDTDTREPIHESPSIGALKKKLIKPVKVNVRVCTLDESWRSNGGEEVRIFTVHTVTPTGTMLATSEGKNVYETKLGRYEDPWIYDADKVAKRHSLRKEINALNKKLEALMDGWPKATRETILAMAKAEDQPKDDAPPAAEESEP